MLEESPILHHLLFEKYDIDHFQLISFYISSDLNRLEVNSIGKFFRFKVLENNNVLLQDPETGILEVSEHTGLGKEILDIIKKYCK